MMKASELDWSKLPNFSAGEWPTGVLEHMDARVIEALQRGRAKLPAQFAMHPSPLPRAHVRDTGDSQHSTQGGTRLSTATDFFMKWDTVWDAWAVFLADPEVGGVGIYVDTWLGDDSITRPMLHVDARPERLMWVCWRKGGKDGRIVYTYHHQEPRLFHRMLAERGMERRRV